MLRHGAAAAMALLASAGMSVAQEKVKVTGEVIDTWCYLSGVMGGPEAVVGTAHHTCAMWCAAAGIPIGLLAEDGTLFMVLKLEGAGTASGTENILRIQSNKITAEGVAYKRDGQNYLIVDKVVANAGITVKNHGEVGVVPPNAIPEQVVERVKKQ
jgi:hypothetical protein